MNIIQHLTYYPEHGICPLCMKFMEMGESDGYDLNICTKCDLDYFDGITQFEHNKLHYRIIYYDQTRKQEEYRILIFQDINERSICHYTVWIKNFKIYRMFNSTDIKEENELIYGIVELQDLYDVGEKFLKMEIFK